MNDENLKALRYSLGKRTKLWEDPSVVGVSASVRSGYRPLLRSARPMVPHLRVNGRLEEVLAMRLSAEVPGLWMLSLQMAAGAWSVSTVDVCRYVTVYVCLQLHWQIYWIGGSAMCSSVRTEVHDTKAGPGLPSYCEWLRQRDSKRVPASNSRRELPWPRTSAISEQRKSEIRTSSLLS